MTDLVLSEISVPRTYTITLAEEGRLEDLSKATGKNKSELVREAINLLFEKEMGLIAFHTVETLLD
jgi:predicted DNA-binding protein